MILQFELTPVQKVAATFTSIAGRLLALQPAFKQAEHVLEKGEQKVFERDLVATGHLRASLTQATANDAIREAHANESVFGTQVYYARAAAHKAGHPALVVTDHESHEIAALTLEYVVRGL